jgi:hypothetical protein
VFTLTPGTITGNGTIYITIGDGVQAIFDEEITLPEGTAIIFFAEADDDWNFS